MAQKWWWWWWCCFDCLLVCSFVCLCYFCSQLCVLLFRPGVAQNHENDIPSMHSIYCLFQLLFCQMLTLNYIFVAATVNIFDKHGMTHGKWEVFVMPLKWKTEIRHTFPNFEIWVESREFVLVCMKHNLAQNKVWILFNLICVHGFSPRS